CGISSGVLVCACTIEPYTPPDDDDGEHEGGVASSGGNSASEAGVARQPSGADGGAPSLGEDDLFVDPEMPRCGDGRLDDDETCDDGNTDPNDGCAADCDSIDEGFTCAIEGTP